MADTLDICSDITPRLRSQVTAISFQPKSVEYLRPAGIVVIARNAFVALQKMGFTNLTNLNLNYNDIQSIDPGAFAGLERLEILNISSNQIESFGPDRLVGLNGLKHLDGSGNQLQAIDAGAFAHMPQLETLDLRGNTALVYIGPHAWGTLRELRMTKSFIPSSGSYCWLKRSIDEEDNGSTERSKQVYCSCAVDKYQLQQRNINTSILPGGSLGSCVCPTGQFAIDYGGFVGCYQCPRGEYSEHINAANCTLCPVDSDWTVDVGSSHRSDCVISPQLSQLHGEIVYLRMFFSTAGGLTLILLVLSSCCVYHRSLERDCYERDLCAKAALLQQQANELDYIDNWRIKHDEIRFDSKVAQGGQGSVWLGSIRGREERLIIKKELMPRSNGKDAQAIQTPVWLEREVSERGIQ